MSASGEQRRRGDGRRRSFRVSGDRLRALRIARGWSQHEAAERAGVSDRSIRKAEAGGPLEIKSVALLAELYSAPDAPLTPHDLVAGLGEAADAASHAARHEALVRRWFHEIWNQRRLQVLDELASPDFQWHSAEAVRRGRAGFREHLESLRAVWGNFDVRLEQVIVQGDWVASRWRAATTRRRRQVVNGSTWLRVANGQLVEAWDYWQHFT